MIKKRKDEKFSKMGLIYKAYNSVHSAMSQKLSLQANPIELNKHLSVCCKIQVPSFVAFYRIKKTASFVFKNPYVLFCPAYYPAFCAHHDSKNTQ